jgi:putative PIN family toxin of toxin-antitoxin system
MRDVNEPLRVVLDTNVLVSAIGFRGRIYKIWELAVDRHFKLFASTFLIEEFRRNLVAKRGMSPPLALEWAEEIKRVAAVIEPTIRLSVIARNDADNRILECAVEARAHILVTGNMKDLRPLGQFRGIAIETPREFLDRRFGPRG